MPPPSETQDAAGLLPRAAAFLVDVTLLAAAIQAVHWSLYFATEGSRELLESPRALGLFLLVTVTLPCWAYFALTEASARRATLGKRLMRLGVSDAYGARIGLGRSLFRNAVKLVPWELTHVTLVYPTPVFLEAAPQRFRVGFLVVYGLIGLYLGAAMMTRRSQSVHDLAAGTYVHRLPPGPPGR